jgi:NAD(P)-dependent dehydrogenase (short-subunit alcohol dehydrogenase family)
MPLADRPRVVITGAGSGLGRAFCIDLAQRGARLIAADIDLASAEETVALMGGSGSRAMRCDVASADDVGKLAEQADRDFGGVDLVINNAGVGVAGRVGEIPIADWDWIIGVNLKGVVHGCHHFVPRLRAQGSGAILNVASAAGLISAPLMAPYNATKAAVVALSEALHAELASTPISVSVLCPTFFQTNIHNATRGATEKTRGAIAKMMKRATLQASDVARFALDKVASSDLYAVPHADGRWLWRLKRTVPAGYSAIVAKLAARGMFEG